MSRVGWWMGHYQSATPKRHYGYANSPVIHRIDRGKLQGWRDRGVKKVETAHKYKDKGGKNRYKGTASLRSTESLETTFINIFLVTLIWALPHGIRKVWTISSFLLLIQCLWSHKETNRIKKTTLPSGSTRSHSADTCATSWRTWNALGEGSLSCQVSCRQLWCHFNNFSQPTRIYGDMLGLLMFTIIYVVTRSYRYRLSGVMSCLLECMRFRGTFDRDEIAEHISNQNHRKQNSKQFYIVFFDLYQKINPEKKGLLGTHTEPILNPFWTHTKPIILVGKPRVFSKTPGFPNPYRTRTKPIFYPY